MTVGDLLAYAYGVEFFQVAGSDRRTADRFDIEAKFSEGADSKDDRRMLGALLKDRFRLAFHIERRDLEVYALVVGKHGADLKPSLPDAADLKPGGSSAGQPATKPATVKNPDGSSTASLGKRGTQTTRFDQENMAQHWELSKATMEELAQRLSICMDASYHKVVDETGVKGDYRVAYDCPVPRPHRTVDTGAPGMLASDPEGVDPLTRSLNALGLKLEKRNMPMDVYVIDHVEQPSEN